jgi:hypothetical protein
MPSYLDFNSTKSFRDSILSRTLQAPNGPQTFNSSNYLVQTLSDFANVDPGEVDTNRRDDLSVPQSTNTYKPIRYFVKENIETLPRRANLNLYFNGSPYFRSENHNLVSILSNSNYDNESELFKFAASYIRDRNEKGPFYARLQQNLYTATVGRVRILDALNGNLSTAINIVRGKESLVAKNYKITTARTIAGQAIDFLQTINGITFPFPEIPGDYLSNPANPVNYREINESTGEEIKKTQMGKVFQDLTGALGSLIGIQRRPKLSRKPSDLLIEYMGDGQKQILFDLLSYSTYAPNYTTTARSQQSSKIFSFVDKIAQGAKNILGTEAPAGRAYIGDDRGNDVKYATNDFNDRPVRSSYYLSLMFHEESAILFKRDKNYSEGGSISGNLTWYSTINNIDINEKYINGSLSKTKKFREDSILGLTQKILDTRPKDGGAAKSHIANVIDQTTRIFQDGDVYHARGSAVQSPSVFKTKDLDGTEFCRTWTKNRPYLNYNDTMKKGSNIRKYPGSVISDPWNLNIAPISDGKKDFGTSTNIGKGYQYGADKDGKTFYAKKYMFSIENLAWKTSNRPGFTVADLPIAERGPNGGRVMWFPPYDLKVSENNSARWESNSFLGRPEPIYTYQNTERSGTIGFKIVVDHPSILNLLTNELFKNPGTPESDENFLNAFFAGCKDIDFYELMRNNTTLTKDDTDLIQAYLNEGGDFDIINKYTSTIQNVVTDNPSVGTSNTGTSGTESLAVTALNFDNGLPTVNPDTTTSSEYTSLYNTYYGKKSTYTSQLFSNLNTLLASSTTNALRDKKNIWGTETPLGASLITDQVLKLNGYFDEMQSNYNQYNTKLTTLKTDITNKTVQSIKVNISSSTSSIDTVDYNSRLSLRRSYSVVLDIFKKISANGTTYPTIKWVDSPTGTSTATNASYNLSEFGYEGLQGTIQIDTTNVGETYSGNATSTLDTNCINRDFRQVTNLNIVAPISFFCRKSEVSFTYQKTAPTTPTTTNPAQASRLKIVEDGQTNTQSGVRKPPIDVMKRIVMKTLSESYYFKKLEETDEFVFKSLKEKLKYFHPGFHSTTPEGLNSRLTFLQQCIRPGDTIPIKGVSDDSDLPARNTTFGPPPICVLRIGDFYHSKVVIRDINISYEEGTWDLNPEGIGMQPMIASVQLQVNFIGGQGLEKPIERLQNALSSNFYANTEIYDERSQISLTGENLKNYNTLTKEQLGLLVKPKESASKTVNDALMGPTE